jgi:hypothetical protein
LLITGKDGRFADLSYDGGYLSTGAYNGGLEAHDLFFKALKLVLLLQGYFYSNNLLSNDINLSYKLSVVIFVVFALLYLGRRTLGSVGESDISLLGVGIGDRGVEGCGGYGIRGA